MWYRIIVLLLIVTVALYTDIKENKIKNKHLLYGIITGLAISIITGGVASLKDSILGIIIPFVILIAFYSMRMLGAGDVKLYCTIGAIMGVNFVINNLIYTFLIAGILVIIMLILKRKLFEVIKGIYYYFKALIIGRSIIEFPQSKGNKFPFAIAIFTGTIIQIIVKYIFLGG